MATEAHTRSTACLQCGVEFEYRAGRGRPRKTCSARCLSLRGNRLAGARPLDVVKRERREAALRTCLTCGEQFVKNGGGNPGKYCSKRCARGLSLQAKMVRAEAAIYKAWAKRARKLSRLTEPQGRKCKECGAPAPKWRQRCEPCRIARKAELRRGPAGKAWKRAAKARRRAIERDPSAERFDPFEIFERDSWRCHMCGVRTRRRLRGTAEPLAPELDHIRPLALGGKHTRQNTACSCRKCNHAKGAKDLGQLRLVA